MSRGWHPDDSLFDRDKKGEFKGARRVRDALRKSGVRAGDRVTTSRDTGMAAARNALKRTGMPPGVEQWQLPVDLPYGKVLVFFSRVKPGTVVPEHKHDVWVFRYILQGSMKYQGKTYKVGDWIFVPAGHSYSIQAGPAGYSILYCHGKIGPPPPPPGPHDDGD